MFVSYSVYQWYDERKYAIKNNEYPTVKKKIMNQCQTISIKYFSVLLSVLKWWLSQ